MNGGFRLLEEPLIPTYRTRKQSKQKKLNFFSESRLESMAELDCGSAGNFLPRGGNFFTRKEIDKQSES